MAAAALVAFAVIHDTAHAQGAATSGPGSTPAFAQAPDSAALGEAAERVLPRNGLLRTDRLQHFSLSFALGLGVGIAGDSPAAGAGVAVAVGFLKEVDDGRHGRTFDRLDLLADLLGAGLAMLATAAIRR